MNSVLQPIAQFAASMAAHGLTPPECIEADGRIHRFSTNGKRGDTAGGYVLHLDQVAAGAFWDWRTGLYATWCSHSSEAMSPAERRMHEERMAAHRTQSRRDRTAALRKNRERIDGLWAASVPVTQGDPVHTYLRGRGLILATVPEVLRLHPALDYWDFDESGKAVKRGTYPAMLAAVQGEAFPEGPHSPGVLSIVALHRTYLTPEGRKADVPTPKKLTGTTGDMRGAAIRLAAPAFIEGAYRLGVAEGIETALAAAEGSGVPTWATVSASGMKSFRWPRTPHELYVFADNDANETGQRAARELERKANACGVCVHTLIPPIEERLGGRVAAAIGKDDSMNDKQTDIAGADAVQEEIDASALLRAAAAADAPTVTIKKRRKVTATKPEAPSPEPEPTPEAFADAVKRLAALPVVEFERCRKAEADALGVRVAMLSEHVDRARRETAHHQQAQGNALTLLSGAITSHAGRQRMDFGNGRYEVSDKDGVWFVSLDAETGAERKTWICSTLHIVARTRDENSVSWGVLLRWKDPSGVQHEMALPMQMLQTDGADMRRALADQGLTIAANQSGRQHLQTYMLVWNPGRFARCVNRMGWHADVFVMPGMEYANGDEITVFQNVHAVDPAFAVAGTLDDWRASVARLAVGNSRLVFAIASAFSGALLECSGNDSGGFHFRGASSTGKSTAQIVASSVWGSPAKYKRSWRFTANGLEGIAALHNDGILILDELSECPAKDAGEAVYMLANGQGKGRATKTGAARQAQSWRLVFLSSGEESLASVMAKSGQQVKAGQEIRLVEIDADAGGGMGMFEQLNGAASPAALAQDLKRACAQFHGAPGPAWLETLVKLRPTLGAQVKASVDAFVAAQVPKEASGQVVRVAQRFGLVAVAGELASAAGITGWKAGASTDAAARCFASWIANFGSAGNREDRALLEQVRAFFEVHGSSRFEDLTARFEQRVANRAGFFRKDGDGEREYLVLPEAFKREVCAGFDVKTAGKVLVAARWLKPGSNGRASRTERLPGMGDKTRVYVFTTALWSEADHDA